MPKKLKNILVTGGAGYIGSHTCVELLEAGYGVVVVDNLDNGFEEALVRVEQIALRDLMYVNADIRDPLAMDKVFADFSIDAVIHFAGLKSVPESVEKPELYYEVNLGGSIALCDAMERHGVRNMVFSSSATVYGFNSYEPITEYADTRPVQPYGKTKLAVEKHLRERCEAGSGWNAVALRYFNPVGAHPSGLIGENPRGEPNNLTPYITQVAVGKREKLMIYGRDYHTKDGTGVRDYIHVVDVARGHVRALDLLEEDRNFMALNLGTGKPYSVLEVLTAFERAVGRKIPFEYAPAREGDLAIYFADVHQAEMELGWRTQHDMDDMARDAWNWQQKNPEGYES
jgi:UDP-glucose 4-epimerase